MYQSTDTQTITSTRQANKVDTTKIDRLSVRIAALDAEIIRLRSAIRKAKLSISRGLYVEGCRTIGVEEEKGQGRPYRNDVPRHEGGIGEIAVCFNACEV